MNSYLMKVDIQSSAAMTTLYKNISAVCLVLAICLFLGGCASSKGIVVDEVDSSGQVVKTPDPYENFNRKVFRFNSKLDEHITKPIAKTYKKVLPGKVRKGIGNFFSNLSEPLNIVNDLLQGKVSDAAHDTGRFLVNSTVGVLGFMDVATKMGIEKNKEDFGQTFAKWGIPRGPYLVLPFLGPSSVRDTAGFIPHVAYTDLVGYIEPSSTRLALRGLRIVDFRARLLGSDDLLEMQLDPYVFLRESYFQLRTNQIHDGNPPQLEEDNFEDELLDDMFADDE